MAGSPAIQTMFPEQSRQGSALLARKAGRKGDIAATVLHQIRKVVALEISNDLCLGGAEGLALWQRDMTAAWVAAIHLRPLALGTQ